MLDHHTDWLACSRHLGNPHCPSWMRFRISSFISFGITMLMPLIMSPFDSLDCPCSAKESIVTSLLSWSYLGQPPRCNLEFPEVVCLSRLLFVTGVVSFLTLVCMRPQPPQMPLHHLRAHRVRDDGLCDRVSATARLFPGTYGAIGLNHVNLSNGCWHLSSAWFRSSPLMRVTSDLWSVNSVNESCPCTDICKSSHMSILLPGIPSQSVHIVFLLLWVSKSKMQLDSTLSLVVGTRRHTCLHLHQPLWVCSHRSSWTGAVEIISFTFLRQFIDLAPRVKVCWTLTVHAVVLSV